MCAPSPPPPPDYAAAAKQQGESNLEAAIATSVLSNPNIVSPYGSRTVTYNYNTPQQATSTPQTLTPPKSGMSGTGWDSVRNYNTPGTTIPGSPQVGGGQFIGGTVPVPTITDTLSPVGQKLFDTENTIKQNLLNTAQSGLSRVDKAMATPFNMKQVQKYTVKPGVAGKEDVVEALMKRVNPTLEDRRRQEQEALLMQGHNRGGAAWDASQRSLNQAENDALMAAILAGGQEQSRLAGLESSRRAQDIQEQAYLRNIPLSEVNALRTGNQPGMPQFQAYQGANVAAAPYFDATLAAGNYAQQTYQNQLANSGGLFDLGGSLLGAAGAAKGFGNLFSL